jgi:hypothetical protein
LLLEAAILAQREKQDDRFSKGIQDTVDLGMEIFGHSLRCHFRKTYKTSRKTKAEGKRKGKLTSSIIGAHVTTTLLTPGVKAGSKTSFMPFLISSTVTLRTAFRI